MSVDEDFWATVLKKWSDGVQRNLELKKELAEAQEECRQHQENAHTSQAEQERLSRDLNHLKEEYHAYTHALQKEKERVQFNENTLHELERAESSLYSANVERVRLEQQLAAAAEQIKIMSFERQDLDQKNNVLVKDNTKLQVQLEKSRSDNDRLQIELLYVQPRNQDLQNELEQQRQMTFEENSRAALLKSENKTLHDELIKARESADVMGLAHKQLLVKFTAVKNVTTQITQPPPSPQKEQKEAEVQADAFHDERGPIPKPLPLAPGPSTMAPAQVSPISEPIKNDKELSLDILEVEDDDLQVSLSMPVTTPTPDPRLRGLEDLVQFIPDVDDHRTFRRELLKNEIGGSGQPLIEKLSSSQTALAKARNVNMYLCPGLDHNPWCPKVPGQHGFIFVGLGNEKDTFKIPQCGLNVFVSFSQTRSGAKQYRYLGVYTAVTVASLNLEEWNALSQDVKLTYAKTTIRKNKLNNQSVDQVLASYNTGELLVPCVRLECTDFDSILYKALLVSQSKPQDVVTSAVGKRVRNEHDDECQLQRRTRARRQGA